MLAATSRVDTLRIGLAVGGAVLQLGGVLAVAWPDVLPYRDEFSRWLRATWQRFVAWLRRRRFVAWLRRLLRLQRPQVIEFEPVVTRDSALSATASKEVGATAPIERQLADLRRRVGEAATKLKAQEERLDALEEDLPRRLEELRKETHEHVSESISAAEARDRPLRIFGAVLLAVGLTLTTVAALL